MPRLAMTLLGVVAAGLVMLNVLTYRLLQEQRTGVMVLSVISGQSTLANVWSQQEVLTLQRFEQCNPRPEQAH